LIFSGIRFLGASQALILFDDYDLMMEAFATDMHYWNKFFDKVRPWI